MDDTTSDLLEIDVNDTLDNQPDDGGIVDSGRGAFRVNIEKYNDMYAAWREKQSIDFVAKKCGVHWQTARRYIEDGDPKRHLRPIKIRFAEVMVKAQKKEDYTLVRANTEMRKAARAYFIKLVQRIEKMKPDELDPNKVGTALREAQQIINKSFGEADIVVEAKGRFEGWTIEELTIYSETGVAPARDKALPS